MIDIDGQAWSNHAVASVAAGGGLLVSEFEYFNCKFLAKLLKVATKAKVSPLFDHIIQDSMCNFSCTLI